MSFWCKQCRVEHARIDCPFVIQLARSVGIPQKVKTKKAVLQKPQKITKFFGKKTLDRSLLVRENRLVQEIANLSHTCWVNEKVRERDALDLEDARFRDKRVGKTDLNTPSQVIVIADSSSVSTHTSWLTSEVGLQTLPETVARTNKDTGRAYAAKENLVTPFEGNEYRFLKECRNSSPKHLISLKKKSKYCNSVFTPPSESPNRRKFHDQLERHECDKSTLNLHSVCDRIRKLACACT